MKPGAIWLFSFYLVTILMVICLFIYGFDISMSGGRRALTSQIKNSGQTDFFYKIDDKFAFTVFTDYGNGVGMTAYTRSYIPFCFVCGWNMGDPEDDRSMFGPVYKSGDLIYAARTDSDIYGVPENVFPTYNVRTKQYSYVEDSLELGSDPFHQSKKLTHKIVADQYDELSYESADDEDCMISFGAIFLSYIILAVWWSIQALVWLLRRGLKKT
jgi:hypothetical protein